MVKHIRHIEKVDFRMQYSGGVSIYGMSHSGKKFD